MSIWGKVLGGAAGFAVGGPIGALLGGIAGHAVDSMRSDIKRLKPPDPEHADPGGFHAQMPGGESTRQVAFTVGVIVLGAKMAKADGQVTPDEVRAFKEVFHVPPEEEKNVGRLFNLARRDARGFEPYAKQLGRLFADQPVVLERLLDALFHIAQADGEVSPPELAYLEQVAQLFGLNRDSWGRAKAANMNAAENPYTILGVDPKASDEEIKARHRELVREHHPDRLIAQGMPEEMVQVANEQLARINSAYDEVRRLRGRS
ncbi:MAG: TerB family tellurite resistance protein [Pseudomonadota bacterium]